MLFYKIKEATHHMVKRLFYYYKSTDIQIVN